MPSHLCLVIISGHNRTRAAHRAGLAQIPAWVREMDDDAAFMQLILSNAQGELSPLERGMHALAATEKHGDIKAYALAVGRKAATVQGEVQAARVAKNGQPFFGDLLERTNQLIAIHSAPQVCWPTLVKRMVDGKWNREQTIAAVKVVLAVKPPRGYEKLFAIEKLQELAAAGQDPTEVTRLAVRSIERARADIRDVQFAVEEFSTRF